MDLIAFHCGASLDVQFGLGCVRLWRIRRVAAFLKSLEERVSLSYNLVNMTNGALLILTDCHLFGAPFRRAALTCPRSRNKLQCR